MRASANPLTPFKPFLSLLRQNDMKIVTRRIPESSIPWGGYYHAEVTHKKLGGVVSVAGDHSSMLLENRAAKTPMEAATQLLDSWKRFFGLKIESFRVTESAFSAKRLGEVEFMTPQRKKVAEFLKKNGLEIVTRRSSEGGFSSHVVDKKLGGIAGTSVYGRNRASDLDLWRPVVIERGQTKRDSRLKLLDQFRDIDEIQISPTDTNGKLHVEHHPPVRKIETKRFGFNRGRVSWFV